MIELSDKVCLCYDYGSYISVAERLGREDGFGMVYYFIPKISDGYPTHKPLEIGMNVPNVKVIEEWASIIEGVDIVVFTDSHEPQLQLFFERMGKKVFGCRNAAYLEHDRYRLKLLIEELGLPVSDWEFARGIDELERALRNKQNVYVKSKLRGDFETQHFDNLMLAKSELERLKNRLGTYAKKAEFIIDEHIDSLAEIGIDTMVVNGLYLYQSLTGCEVKDTGYAGSIMPYDRLPKQLRLVCDKFSGIFQSLGYRGAFSNEVMIGEDNKGYLLDNTCRQPQPPTDLMLEMYDNYPEIVWQVANGVVPEVKYTYKYGVQFIIKSDTAKTDPSPIIVPEEYQKYVKLKNKTIDEKGMWWYVPLSDIEMSEIGSVVSFGFSLKEAIKTATKIADSLKGLDIKINTDCVSKVDEQIQRLKDIGINYLS